MKVIVFFAVVSLALAKPGHERLPSFKVFQDKSLGAIPKIEVTFPNGHVDRMVLERYFANEADRQSRKLACNFIGHLEKESTACVAVTGCLGQDDLEMTIMSKHAGPNGMVVLRKDNTVEIIENPFNHPDIKIDTARVPDHVRNSGWHEANTDEMVNDEDLAEEMHFEELCASGDCSSIPTTNLMQIKFGYDDTFLNSFGSVTELETYIVAMQVHVQTHMCHETLGTKIQLERVGDITHHAGQTWKAESDSGSLSGPIKDITAAQTVGADLYVYMAKDEAFYGVVGLAWVGTLCKHTWAGYQASINEKRDSVLSTAKIVSHEMGHNMGMSHDFDDVHGGQGSACNGQGLMSYGSVPEKWSDCSRADFLALYNQIIASSSWSWCMPAAPNACGTTTPPPPPSPTTTTIAPPPTKAPDCVFPNWKGDNWCDDENNVESCEWDGGDCCGDDVRTTYCTACECLDPNFGGPTTTTTTTTTTTKAPDCVFPSWKGDNWCDDENNVESCDWDGGDCCGDDVRTNYCTACECLDPGFTTTTTTTTTTKAPDCVFPNWKGDNWCDDENNVESCDYDGGDCCGDDVRTNFCTACECLDPGFTTTTTTTTTTKAPDCVFPNWQGDNWCDDENNVASCNYDGGDCCGDDVRTTYCKACECLDPNFAGKAP